MASYRPINTAEDVLELLRDVEEDIRRDAHQRAVAARSNDAQHDSDFAAPIEVHKGQSPPPPDTTPQPMSASNTMRPRVRLPNDPRDTFPHLAQAPFSSPQANSLEPIQQPHQLRGARFTVDGLVSQLMISGTKAIVDNLPSLVTEREIDEIFKHYVVEDIIVLRRSPIPEPQVLELDLFLPAQAVVHFSTSLEADRAVEELRDHTILGQRLDVQLAHNVWPKDISTHALQLLDDESPRYPLGGLYLSIADKAYILGRPEVERLEILAERASNLTRTQQDLRLKHALAASSRSSLDDLRGPADDAEIVTSTNLADRMEIDVTSNSALAMSKPMPYQQGTRGKRRKSKGLRAETDDEPQQFGTKRIKITSEKNAPSAFNISSGSGMSRTDQSGLPQQLPSLEWNEREMKLEPYEALEHDFAASTPPVLGSRWSHSDVSRGRANNDRILAKLGGLPPAARPHIRPDTSREVRPLDFTNNDHERRRNMFRSSVPGGTDRYVPSNRRPRIAADSSSHTEQMKSRSKGSKTKATERPASFVGFSNLPGDVQDKIFTILLKGDDQVNLSTSWLMGFVNNAINPPSVLKPNRSNVLKPAFILRSDLESINDAAKTIPYDSWPSNPAKSNTSGLTLSLLTASRPLQARAARIFYSTNTFNFHHPKTSWLHFEAFLATIGPLNTSHLRHLRLAAPQWHPGVRRNAITGALFDATSPVTRLAACTDPAEDRLLAALENCCRVLVEAGSLESLQIDLSYPEDAASFAFQGDKDSQFPIHKSDLPWHVARKEKGIALLRGLSEAMGPGNAPRLVLHAAWYVSPAVVEGFRRGLAAVTREAVRYGWIVDQVLREPERTGHRGQQLG